MRGAGLACGDVGRMVRCVNAEYLGILTILEPEPQARPASLIRRPRSQNITYYITLR